MYNMEFLFHWNTTKHRPLHSQSIPATSQSVKLVILLREFHIQSHYSYSEI
jgi:hypothetical protein